LRITTVNVRGTYTTEALCTVRSSNVGPRLTDRLGRQPNTRDIVNFGLVRFQDGVSERKYMREEMMLVPDNMTIFGFF